MPIENWREGTTREQRNTFHAACGDLASQISWHGFRLTKADFRHLISGTVLGWRMMPAIDSGEGRQGMIMLGGSSLDLNKKQTSEALEMAFAIGDHPQSQGLNCEPVRWCAAVCGARWIQEE